MKDNVLICYRKFWTINNTCNLLKFPLARRRQLWKCAYNLKVGHSFTMRQTVFTIQKAGLLLLINLSSMGDGLATPIPFGSILEYWWQSAFLGPRQFIATCFQRSRDSVFLISCCSWDRRHWWQRILESTRRSYCFPMTLSWLSLSPIASLFDLYGTTSWRHYMSCFSPIRLPR